MKKNILLLASLTFLIILVGQVTEAQAIPIFTDILEQETSPGDTNGGGIDSLSSSFVVFDPSVGGNSSFIPGQSQTFCFRAESFTNDWGYAFNVWQRFPTDWTVTNVYVQGTPTCDSTGYFGSFSWSWETSPYEVNINHPRNHANPTDHCIAYY